MTQEIKFEFIPVRFLGGTGGNFLASWLTQAKTKSQDGFEFSRHGNCHYSKREYRLHEKPFWPWMPFKNQMEGIVELVHSPDLIGITQPPYFVCSENVNLNILRTRYPKVINITFDQTDCVCLGLVLLGKWGLDENEHAQRFDQSMDLLNTPPGKLIKIWAGHFRFNNYLFDSSTFVTDDNSINVTWKEMFTLNPSIIISKLSRFTDIPEVDFHTDTLLEWRKSTSAGVELTKSMLITLKNTEPSAERSAQIMFPNGIPLGFFSRY